MDHIVSTIVEKLKKIPFCQGIIYAGSRAEGDFVTTSAYDFTVLTARGKTYFTVFKYKGHNVDAPVGIEKEISRRDINRDKVANPELAILAHGEILYDTGDRMRAIQKKAQRVWKLGPKKYTRRDYQEAGYLCMIFLHKLSKKHSDRAFHSWNEVMDKMTRMFFALHRAWMPKPTLRENRIKEIDQHFFTLYTRAYTASAQTRVAATKNMIRYVVKKFDLPQTGDVYLPREN